MLFQNKEKKIAKPEIFLEKNIYICEAEISKEEAIEKVGTMLVESGYVKPSYIDGMKQREEVFSTNIGNSVAIPHGVEAAKKEVIHSGISVMVVPNGVDWNGDKVKMVIGIAGVGEDHVNILANIAERISEPEQVEHLVGSTPEGIYKAFSMASNE